jgi:hypothetical protein
MFIGASDIGFLNLYPLEDLLTNIHDFEAWNIDLDGEIQPIAHGKMGILPQGVIKIK